MSAWWLPEDWSAYERSVFDAFDGFTNDIKANPNVLSDAERKQYTQLYKRFTDWHNSLGWLSWANSNNKQVAELYAQNLQYWRGLYNSKSSTPATGPGTSILLPKATPTTTDNLKYIAVTVAAAAALSSIAKLIRG
jgi:hypothetical protein